jgi:hypothetical protein
MIPLRPKNSYTRIKESGTVLSRERRKPNAPGPYIYVSGGAGDTTPLATWQSPEWQNSFTYYGDSYVGFRHGLDGYPEFVGRLDLTAGAVTGTVAWTLPVPWRSISFDYTFPIFMSGTDWQAGVMSIDAVSGDVTVYWPVIT